MLVPVYDIKNCGPRHRFSANGKLVHNSDSVNLQNLPRGSALKNAMEAPEGYVFIDCDSSQIEARTLAWLAGQDDLVDFFRKNNAEIAAGVKKKDMQFDPYKIMASEIYGVPVMDVTDDQRFVGKTTILGAGYGMGANKFQLQLRNFGVALSLDECIEIIQIYRATYPKITELWRKANTALDALMSQRTSPLGEHDALTVDLLGIRLPNGLYIRYPDLHKRKDAKGNVETVYSTKKGKNTLYTRIYGGKVVENVCQALARIIIGEQMLAINRNKHVEVVMTVHDAVGSLVKADYAVEGRKFIEDCMRIPPKWATGLPLNCESKMGASYGGK